MPEDFLCVCLRSGQGFGGFGDPSILGTGTGPVQAPFSLQNPLSMVMLSSALGIDFHKLIAPAMLAQGGGGTQGHGAIKMMLPMMMSGFDPSAAMMVPLLMNGGGGLTSNPIASMLLGHAVA